MSLLKEHLQPSEKGEIEDELNKAALLQPYSPSEVPHRAGEEVDGTEPAAERGDLIQRHEAAPRALEGLHHRPRRLRQGQAKGRRANSGTALEKLSMF